MHAGLLWLHIHNKWGREEGAVQNEFCLLTGEGARHPAGKKLLLQIVMYFMHVRIGGRVIGQDNRFCQGRHVPKREAMCQVLTKERVSRKKTMFRKEETESVRIVRMWNTFKNRAMLGGREGEGQMRNDRVREVGVGERKRACNSERFFRRFWGDKSR